MRDYYEHNKKSLYRDPDGINHGNRIAGDVA